MNKFLAVIKREYVQRVRSKMFIVMTVLGPLMMVVFTVVPALIFGIKAGGPTRVAVVDLSGRMYERVRDSLLRDENREEEAARQKVDVNKAISPNANDRVEQVAKAGKPTYAVEQVSTAGRSEEEIKSELNRRVEGGQLDGYIIIPADILTKREAIYYARNVGDMFTRGEIEDRLSRAVSDQLLEEHNISQSLLRDINEPVHLSGRKAGARGEEGGSDNQFWFVFACGFLIYITILMYGQTILGAVIEEKETRIAEVLFSSMRSFPLMMGKLIGVSLVALTQYAIWGLAVAVFALYGASALASRGMDVSLPHIPLMLVLYLVVFFLLGYFIYATFYALVGSMVTTTQEGGQLSLPVIFLLVMGFYLAFPVIRSPDSSFAFWVSMVPFFSPITMLVRIVTQTPPFWQIALSLAIGFGTVVLLVWLAARVYRVGMLMYGKRASIPEVLRWIRQA
ncbi:MAG: ABC transporter permease [Pyrinomonadaceae bacterium]